MKGKIHILAMAVRRKKERKKRKKEGRKEGKLLSRVRLFGTPWTVAY